MVTRKEIARIISGYENPRIGVLGSHSALEIMDGAKDEDFQTVVFCQKGRETPYKKFSRIADEIIVVENNKFSEMANIKVTVKKSCGFSLAPLLLQVRLCLLDLKKF